MSARWGRGHDWELARQVSEGRLFYTEIAEAMGMSVHTVRYHARRLKLPRFPARGRLGEKNVKHKHLAYAAFVYYLTHTAEETARRFKLAPNEFRSLRSAGYRDKSLKHLRKEKRKRTPWSTRELLFLLRHAGLRPRKWIAGKLKRGNATCMKERLQALGVCSRTINSITLSQFQQAFGERPAFYLMTDAGPGRNGTPTYFKIVPWAWLDKELKAGRLKTAPVFRDLVATMALFQNWIHGGDAVPEMLKIIRRSFRGGARDT